MRTIATAFVVSLALGAAVPAFASESGRCGNVAKDKWLSEQAIKEKIGALGYEIREVEADDGCYEVKAVDKNGARLELYVQPDTGEIVKPGDKHKS